MISRRLFPTSEKPVSARDTKSLHDEIKEKLVVIGELLGFESRAEVRITAGAVVDAVWEAKIGNIQGDLCFSRCSQGLD